MCNCTPEVRFAPGMTAVDDFVTQSRHARSVATKQSIRRLRRHGLLPPSLIELRRTSRYARNDEQQQPEEATHVPRQTHRPRLPPRRRTEAFRFPPRGMSGTDTRRGRGPPAHDLALARSLHARAHERWAVLRAAGADRRRDGGRHGQRGDRVQQSRLCQGRHRAVARRLADACGLRRQGSCQDRSEDRADLDRGRRARHARHDRLHRAARYRQAAGGRDRRRRGGLGRGRFGRRPDRAASRARARSASPAARTSATTSRRNSASTIASITAIRIWRRS